MARYMITHSLLSSWLYSLKENPYETAESTDDPLADFLRVLRREPTPTTEAMQKGIDFENLVTEILAGNVHPEFVTDGTVNRSSLGDGEVMGYEKYPKWYHAAKKVADIIRGGPLQVGLSKQIWVGGKDILLYGRLDALKAGKIYDIKFSGSYDRGKYIDSTQHPLYLELVPDAQSFVYIVSNGTDVWTEEYRRDEITNWTENTISDFLLWLDAMGYMGLFEERWVAL